VNTAVANLARIVLVTRKTSLQLLLDHHGTLGQARFYLASRGQDIDAHVQAHDRFASSLATVIQAIPPDQRRVRIDREQLDRFLFAPDDIVAIVGQDGLVPNVAKYLSGQLTVGINPDPERYDGVLCRHSPLAMPSLLRWCSDPSDPQFRVERRTMALAQREDGQQLRALNEIFIGHQSHQSARYSISVDDRAGGARTERHSSSGIVCSTGTGATGWARSICEQAHDPAILPRPDEARLVWFVREPFPSVFTQIGLQTGDVGANDSLVLTSEMGQGGVIFADGIETDRLEFLTGQMVRLEISAATFNLVIAAKRDSAASPAASRQSKAKRKSRPPRPPVPD
jgi:NAD kinase